MNRSTLAAFLLLAATAAASAQHASGHHAPAPAAPYAELATRAVKALSDEQIADLRAGRGIGLALPAELNGYPGPVHVLELGAQLELSAEQRTKVQNLYTAMKAETVPIGERLIAQETELDRMFADRGATPAIIEAVTGAIGATYGALRAAHLRYHLATLQTLTPHQVHLYRESRGYLGRHGSGSRN
jgi:hypothetical protein